MKERAIELLRKQPEEKDPLASAEAEIALAALLDDRSKIDRLTQLRFADKTPFEIRYDAWTVLKRLDPGSKNVEPVEEYVPTPLPRAD